MPEFISLLRKIRDEYYPQIKNVMETISADMEKKKTEFSDFSMAKINEMKSLAGAETSLFVAKYIDLRDALKTQGAELTTFIESQRTLLDTRISDFKQYATKLMSTLDEKKKDLDTVSSELKHIHISEPVKTLHPVGGVVAEAKVEYSIFNGGLSFEIPAGRNGKDLAIQKTVANESELLAITDTTIRIVYREDTAKLYIKKDTGQNTSMVDWTEGAPLTPTTLFLDLTDTPLAIEPGKMYIGNAAGNAIEQIDIEELTKKQNVKDMVGLPDLKANAGRSLVVNPTGDGLVAISKADLGGSSITEFKAHSIIVGPDQKGRLAGNSLALKSTGDSDHADLQLIMHADAYQQEISISAQFGNSSRGRLTFDGTRWKFNKVLQIPNGVRDVDAVNFRQVLLPSTWQYPTYLNGFEDDSSSWRSRFRIRGKQVELHINFKGGTDNSDIFELPEGFRPSIKQGLLLSAGTGAKKMQIKTSGTIYLKDTAGTWVNGVVFFSID